MYRIYIKNNNIVNIVNTDIFSEEEIVAYGSTIIEGFDSFIDKDTDHPRWMLVNGDLVEVSMQEAMLLVANNTQ